MIPEYGTKGSVPIYKRQVNNIYVNSNVYSNRANFLKTALWCVFAI